MRWNDVDDSPELQRAGDALSQVLVEREVARLAEWRARGHEEDPAWREAATANQSMLWLTAAELAEINEAIRDLFTRGYGAARRPGRQARGRPALRPDGVGRARLRLRVGPPGARMRKAFAQKGFGRLFAGVSTSMFGDSVMLIVLSMWVKTLTGSNGAAGHDLLLAGAALAVRAGVRPVRRPGAPPAAARLGQRGLGRLRAAAAAGARRR